VQDVLAILFGDFNYKPPAWNNRVANRKRLHLRFTLRNTAESPRAASPPKAIEELNKLSSDHLPPLLEFNEVKEAIKTSSLSYMCLNQFSELFQKAHPLFMTPIRTSGRLNSALVEFKSAVTEAHRQSNDDL
jgi:hypothetical protein